MIHPEEVKNDNLPHDHNLIKKFITISIIIRITLENLAYILLTLAPFVQDLTYPIWGIIILIISFVLSNLGEGLSLKQKNRKNLTLSLKFTNVSFLCIATIIFFFAFRVDYFVQNNSPIYLFALFLILLSWLWTIRVLYILADENRCQKLIQKYLDRKVSVKKTIGSSITAEQKNRLYGMIRINKQLNLEEESAKLQISLVEIQNLIYDLAGKSLITGELKDNIFILTSDVNDFISLLDDSFTEWGTHEKGKIMKI